MIENCLFLISNPPLLYHKYFPEKSRADYVSLSLQDKGKLIQDIEYRYQAEKKDLVHMPRSWALEEEGKTRAVWNSFDKAKQNQERKDFFNSQSAKNNKIVLRNRNIISKINTAHFNLLQANEDFQQIPMYHDMGKGRIEISIDYNELPNIASSGGRVSTGMILFRTLTLKK